MGRLCGTSSVSRHAGAGLEGDGQSPPFGTVWQRLSAAASAQLDRRDEDEGCTVSARPTRLSVPELWKTPWNST